VLLKQEAANDFVKVISGCIILLVFINTDVQSAPQHTISPAVRWFCSDDFTRTEVQHEILCVLITIREFRTFPDRLSGNYRLFLVMMVVMTMMMMMMMMMTTTTMIIMIMCFLRNSPVFIQVVK
jgi:hypothetical protein